ncbi:hypothetical protein BDZ91DRAFT_735530 [Kalaharituber pfeilii]|nr:hypothetical protein BDZ91DRAFT_735530 [Kalaharituber pfeilii]
MKLRGTRKDNFGKRLHEASVLELLHYVTMQICCRIKDREVLKKLQEEWENITKERLLSLVRSMPDRL